MTFCEKFNALKKTYGETADFSAAPDGLAAQIRLTDGDCGGTFYVAYFDGRAAIEPYDYRDHKVDVEIGSALLETLLDGKKDPVSAFLAGEFGLDGDAGHALALIEALKRRPRAAQKKKKHAAAV